MKYVPPSFDRANVRGGLLKAMGFGEPTRTDDKVTFFFPRRAAVSEATDQAGVPFDPTVRPANVGPAKLTVACAVEYLDREGRPISAGDVTPARLVVTLLDEEYQQVKEFSYAVAGGGKYNRSRVEPPVALGSLDIWMLHLVAEDEA